MGEADAMRIGELADLVGVTTKTVRYYESRGGGGARAAHPARARGGGGQAVERLGFIRDAQATGLSLTEIASILELKDHGDRSCEHTHALIDRHLAEIDEQIERLTEARRTLAEMAERAARVDPAECTDPHRCQVIDLAHDHATG
jgi:MerR family copper efflux transcriptional regulator